MSERTALYRLYGYADDLLYIGITNDPERRWAQHAAEKPWWGEVAVKEVTWLESRDLARAFELAAIGREHPRYNIAETPLHRAVSTAGGEPDHPIALRLRVAVRSVLEIDDPLIRGAAATAMLRELSAANGTVCKLRQADVRAMRAEGMTHRQIGGLLGVHFTRVKQIESGQRTGNSA